jgi:hypothetical protein
MPQRRGRERRGQAWCGFEVRRRGRGGARGGRGQRLRVREQPGAEPDCGQQGDGGCTVPRRQRRRRGLQPVVAGDRGLDEGLDARPRVRPAAEIAGRRRLGKL